MPVSELGVAVLRDAGDGDRAAVGEDCPDGVREARARAGVDGLQRRGREAHGGHGGCLDAGPGSLEVGGEDVRGAAVVADLGPAVRRCACRRHVGAAGQHTDHGGGCTGTCTHIDSCRRGHDRVGDSRRSHHEPDARQAERERCRHAHRAQSAQHRLHDSKSPFVGCEPCHSRHRSHIRHVCIVCLTGSRP